MDDAVSAREHAAEQQEERLERRGYLAEVLSVLLIMHRDSAPL